MLSGVNSRKGTLVDDKLNAILNGAKPPEHDPESVMENLGPCAWGFVKPVYALDIEVGANLVVSFQYIYLGMRSEFKPGEFVIYFKDGDELWRVTVAGTNLRPIFDRVMEHRIRRLRAADRPFGDDKVPFIKRIVVELVEEK